MTIFGNDLATDKYAMGSNEALGSPSNFADSSVKTEPHDDEKAAKSLVKHTRMQRTSLVVLVLPTRGRGLSSLRRTMWLWLA